MQSTPGFQWSKNDIPCYSLSNFCFHNSDMYPYKSSYLNSRLLLTSSVYSLAAQSLYKLNSSEEGAGSDPKSPSRRAQASPIGSDVMSPHHVSSWVMRRGRRAHSLVDAPHFDQHKSKIFIIHLHTSSVFGLVRMLKF